MKFHRVIVLPAFVLTAFQGPTQTQRIPQFENGEVKVWKSVVLPNAPLAMHRHDHGRVIIAPRGCPPIVK
jgi:hypothetical protein